METERQTAPLPYDASGIRFSLTAGWNFPILIRSGGKFARILKWGGRESMSETNTNVDTPASNRVANLQAYAGQWVVVQNETVIEHGPDLAQIVENPRSRGIGCPRVLYVEPSRARTVRLGL